MTHDDHPFLLRNSWQSRGQRPAAADDVELFRTDATGIRLLVRHHFLERCAEGVSGTGGSCLTYA